MLPTGSHFHREVFSNTSYYEESSSFVLSNNVGVASLTLGDPWYVTCPKGVIRRRDYANIKRALLSQTFG